jgi:hypothetical protein
MRSVTKRFFAARRFMLLTLGIIGVSHALAEQPQVGESAWSFNTTIIEACSCPNPCPCNFNSVKPAAHSGHEGHGAAVEYFAASIEHSKSTKGTSAQPSLMV